MVTDQRIHEWNPYPIPQVLPTRPQLPNPGHRTMLPSSTLKCAVGVAGLVNICVGDTMICCKPLYHHHNATKHTISKPTSVNGSTAMLDQLHRRRWFPRPTVIPRLSPIAGLSPIPITIGPLQISNHKPKLSSRAKSRQHTYHSRYTTSSYPRRSLCTTCRLHTAAAAVAKQPSSQAAIIGHTLRPMLRVSQNPKL